jgi:hypothetical protein
MSSLKLLFMKIGMSCPDVTSLIDPNNNFDAEKNFFFFS